LSILGKAIRDEWLSDRTYEQRIASGESATVLDDLVEDVLTGLTGLDWFCFDLENDRSTVSRKSSGYFQSALCAFLFDWLDERAERVPKRLKDPAKLREVLKHHDEAKLIWRQVLKRAHAAVSFDCAIGDYARPLVRACFDSLRELPIDVITPDEPSALNLRSKGTSRRRT